MGDTLDKSVGHRRTARRDSQLFTPTSKENFAQRERSQSTRRESTQILGEHENSLCKSQTSNVTAANKKQTAEFSKKTGSSLSDPLWRQQKLSIFTEQASLIWIMNLPLPLPQHVFSLIIKSRHGCTTTAVLLGHYHTCNLCQNWKVSKRQVHAGGPGWSPERQTPTPEQSDREMAATFTLHPSQTQNPGCKRGKEGRWPQCYTPARILCSKLCHTGMLIHFKHWLAVTEINQRVCR